MLQDGILLLDDSVISNLQIQYGSSLPVTGNNLGELFYKTGTGAGLYIFNGSTYDPVGSNFGDIDASQVTSGVFADARIAQSNVTQHQAALTILETQITDGALLARVGDNETITGTWSFNNAVTGVSPSTANQLATKQYVDNVATGLDVKNSVRVATTANITLSGLQTIDGVSLSAADRVLVKDQTTGSQNGIYVVNAGAWVRAADADNSPSTGEVTSGLFTFVTQGTVNGNSGWVLTTGDPITLDSTALTFSQFSAAGAITAGNNITIVGTTISAIPAGAAAQVQYNNGTNFAGSAQFTWDDTNRVLTLGSTTSGSGTTITGRTGTGAAASLSITGGTGFGTATGGSVIISAGSSQTTGSGGSNVGPSLTLRGGTGGGTTPTGGDIVLSTALNTTSYTERLRITNTGEWQLAGSGGTSGQVLTSNGAGAAPVWAAVPSSAAGTLTGTTLASNVVSSSLTSLGTLTSLSVSGATTFSGSPLTVGTNNSTFTITAPQTTTGGQIGGSISIIAGTQNNTSSTAGAITIQGGTGAALNDTGGGVTIQGGTATATGGAVSIIGGTASTTGGAVIVSTGATSVERLRITAAGEWQLASSGGTSGQVLTSNGAAAAPTWQSVTATSATTATNIAGGAANRIPYQSAASTTTFNANLVASDIASANVGSGLTIARSAANASGLLTLVNLTSAVADVMGISFADAGSIGIAQERASIKVIVESSPFNGAMVFSTGLGTAGTYNTGTMTERLRITGSGGISFGSSGTAYGTSGQVLTSAGNAPPTWTTFSPTSLANATILGTTSNSAVSITGLAGTTSASSPMTISAGATSTGTGNSLTLSASGGPTAGGALIFQTATTTTPTERMRINPDGSINVGSNVTVPGVANLGVLISTDTQSGSVLTLRKSTTSATNSSAITLVKSNGTAASPTAVVSGDQLSLVQGAGYDGTNYSVASGIYTLADAAVSTGIVPGRLAFYTTDTAGSFVERMRLSNNGNLNVGGTTSTVKLQVTTATAAEQLRVSNSAASTSAGFGVDTGDILKVYTGGTERFRYDQTIGLVITSVGGIGYSTGAGGTVTQATSKSTSVTLNKATGQITMNNASLAAGASVQFLLNNTQIAANDVLVVHKGSAGTNGNAYRINVSYIAAGTAEINVVNNTGGALAEAIVINFALIKGSNA